MKKQGFTLIELVVVMAIIAILVALMVAALQAARRASTEAERRANVKTIETALEAKYARETQYTGASPAGVAWTAVTVGGATGVPTLVTNLRNQGYLSQDLPGVLTQGYNLVSLTATGYELRGCANTATDTTGTACTAAASLYNAIR